MQRFRLLLEQRDFNRPSKLLALDQIWAFTGIRIRPEKIQFGKAEELDQRPDIDDDENTFVPAEIDPAEDVRYTKDNGFLYRRFSLSELAYGRELVILDPPATFKVEDVLDQINNAWDSQLTLEDLDNTIVYKATDETFVLKACPGSLAWFGNHPYIVRMSGTTAFLNVVDLDGFHLDPDGLN